MRIFFRTTDLTGLHRWGHGFVLELMHGRESTDCKSVLLNISCETRECENGRWVFQNGVYDWLWY